jgi:hypothetical protein
VCLVVCMTTSERKHAILTTLYLAVTKTTDKSILYAECSNNNSYQESLEMASFEMLDGRRCQTPLFWNETGERKFIDSTFCKML